MMLKGLLLNSSQGVKLTILQKPSGNGSDDVTHARVFSSMDNSKVYADEQLEVGVPLVCYTPAELISIEVTKTSTRASFFYTETENLAVSPVSGKLFFYSGVPSEPKYLAFCCSAHSGGGIG